MSDFLSNLLARNRQPGAVIRPRRASWFEPTPGSAAPWPEATTTALGAPPGEPGSPEVAGRAPVQPAAPPDSVSETPPALPVSEAAPAEGAPKPASLPPRPSLIEPARTVSVHAEPEAPRWEPGVEGAAEARPRPQDTLERPGPASPPEAPLAPRPAVDSDAPANAGAPQPIRPKPDDVAKTLEPPAISPSALPPEAPPAPRPAVDSDAPADAGAPKPIRPKQESATATKRPSAAVRPPLADIPSPVPQRVPPHLPRQPAVEAPTIKPNVLADPRLKETTQPGPASSEDAPTIRVSIGRIEVRAVSPPPPPPSRRKTARPAPALSLDDYLKRYSRGSS